MLNNRNYNNEKKEDFKRNIIRFNSHRQALHVLVYLEKQ